MERGLLSDHELSSSYDDVVWMYLFQDFSHSPADRAAERVAIRFGITSWPQHFLVDPYTLAVIGDTGRELASFRRAVAEAAVGEPGPQTSSDLVAADALAARLEDPRASSDLARAHLEHCDVVVRYRAVQLLAQSEPESLVAVADELLSTPHDQIRFQVCQVLAEYGDGRAREALELLVQEPRPSRTPNVLRIRAVTALGRCGGPESIAVIAPFAASGAYFNGLTGVSIQTLVTLASRFPEHTGTVRATLKRAFPALPENPDERELRACTGLAKRVHSALAAVTGEDRPFPAVYDEASRRLLMADW
jgi:hypothetical protein